MPSKFRGNAILIGYIDHYCLVCEAHLRSEEDIIIHIEKPIHKKNLDSTTFIEKFEGDLVRKVKHGYLCEICNMFFTTQVNVGLHVSEKKHKDTQGTRLLRRVGKTIFAFDNILIDDKSWNGLLDFTCILCAIEFENEEIHKTEATHILNLIQNKVEFSVDKSIYRKIDEESFQCLTCNLLLPFVFLSTHFNEPEHKRLYLECLQPDLATSTKQDMEQSTKSVLEQAIQNTKTDNQANTIKDAAATSKEQDKKQPRKTATKQPNQSIATDNQSNKSITTAAISKEQDKKQPTKTATKQPIQSTGTDNQGNKPITTADVSKEQDKKQPTKTVTKQPIQSSGTDNQGNKPITTADVSKEQDKNQPTKTVTKQPIQSTGADNQTNTFIDTAATTKQDTKETTKTKQQQNTRKSKKTETPVRKSLQELEIPSIEYDEAIRKNLVATSYVTEDDTGNKWCLLCDWYMDSNLARAHLESRHHQTLLTMHLDRIQQSRQSAAQTIKTDSQVATSSTNVAKKADIINKKVTEINTSEQDSKSKIINSVERFQKNEININFESVTALCKKCNKNIDFVYETIETHIEEHNKKPVKKDKQTVKLDEIKPPDDKKTTLFTSPVHMTSKSSVVMVSEPTTSSAASSRELDEETKKFACKNDLVFENGKVHCRVCDSSLPSTLNNMKQHINGISHKNKEAKLVASRPIPKPVITKKTLEEFMVHFVCIQNLYFDDVVINKEFCINNYSFMFLTKQRYTGRCYLCDVTLTSDDLHSHQKSNRHQAALLQTPILVSMETEFVREPRPSNYHCGFCNIIEESIEDLERHLESTSHRESKTSAHVRLQQYLPDITRHREVTHMELDKLMRTVMDAQRP